MYELTVALKYLIPRWRQLSVSIISLISVIVIALVVWLIVVFFSVTHGLERSWIEKMLALSAPVRITPTEAYHNSFYYRSDSISANAEYTLKSIGEKLESYDTIAYDPEMDEEAPHSWPELDLGTDGKDKDLVKEVFESVNAIRHVSGIRASDYEMTVGNLQLAIVKDPEHDQQESYLNQVAYLGSYEPDNQSLHNSLLDPDAADIENILSTVSIGIHGKEHLKACLDCISISELTTPDRGWTVPKSLLPESGTFEVLFFSRGDVPVRLILPENYEAGQNLDAEFKQHGYTVNKGILQIREGDLTLITEKASIPLSDSIPIVFGPHISLPAQLDEDSIATSHDLIFTVETMVQGQKFKGKAPLKGLKISEFSAGGHTPFWLGKSSTHSTLTMLDYETDGVILPKNFKSSGVRIGDLGHISYHTATTSSVQEQRLPVYVSGFYDPGIISMGGKFIITSKEATNLIRSSYDTEDTTIATNGINVRFDDYEQATAVKNALLEEFRKRGIDQYWEVETYHEFDFSRDLVQQLKSEKFLFSILSTIIIIVACSNIISMLIILVNDKRTEIGILRAMGASSKSIAMIFGLCGIVMGLLGSVVGIVIGKITLNNLDQVVSFISAMQGHEMFNPLFYGDTLPNEVSFQALLFVLLSTAVISLIAGVVPAVKASMVKPATILRSE